LCGGFMADYWALIFKGQNLDANGEVIPTKIQRGDILEIVPVNTKLPDSTLSKYIIVPITGVLESEIGKLDNPYYEGGADGVDITAAANTLSWKIIGKRKHKVLLTDAALAISGWDAKKATDTHVIYQPFIDKNVKIAIKSVNFIVNKYTDTYRKVFS